MQGFATGGDQPGSAAATRASSARGEAAQGRTARRVGIRAWPVGADAGLHRGTWGACRRYFKPKVSPGGLPITAQVDDLQAGRAGGDDGGAEELSAMSDRN
jgi:hypothetical protein